MMDDHAADMASQKRLLIFIGIGAFAFLVFLLVMTLAAQLGGNIISYTILIALTIITGLFILAIASGLFEKWILGSKH